MPAAPQCPTPRYGPLLCLIVAGEVVFTLPFHVPRFFRPSLLAESGLTNTALGDAFAWYGLLAMLGYFPGGALADRFSARTLLAVSLWATAAGGLVMAGLPTGLELSLLYAYWGVTTILLFWAALIRATREWGGETAQGRAFGLLEGGRGLVAALLASVAVTVLVWGDDGSSIQRVIWFYSAVTALTGVFCWLLIPLPAARLETAAEVGLPARWRVVADHRLWLQALVVICAYCGYKALDYYALLLNETLGMSGEDAARMVSLGAYLRPLAAVGCGLLADRRGARKMVGALFIIGLIGFGGLACVREAPLAWWYANLFVTLVAVYGLRGVYFALLEDSRIETRCTGTAVGVISLLGFTPDVFFAPLAGRLLDAAPGGGGFQTLWALLAALFALGFGAALGLRKVSPAL